MKKLSLLLVAVAFMAWGCSHSYNSMIDSGVGIELKGDGKYEILGDTEASATITKILFLTLGEDGKISGSFPCASANPMMAIASVSPFGLFFGFGDGKLQVEQAAAYKAIQNFEGADQILCPRFKTEQEIKIGGIYAVYSTQLKAKAIKIKK